MKKNMKGIIFTILIITSIPWICSAAELTLGNGEWKPYQSKSLKNGGFCSDVVNQAFSLQGVKVNFRWYGDAWKRAYHDAATNVIDGTLVWSYKKEREQEMYYSNEAVLSGKKDYIFYLKNSPKKYETINDLTGKNLGGVLGYTYGSKIDAAIKNGKIKIQLVSEDKTNFKKLLLGRIDCLISGEEVAKKILSSLGAKSSKIARSNTPVRVVTYHLLLNKKNPANKAIMQKFNMGLKKLKANGTYSKLKQKLESGGYEK